MNAAAVAWKGCVKPAPGSNDYLENIRQNVANAFSCVAYTKCSVHGWQATHVRIADLFDIIVFLFVWHTQLV